MTTMEIEAREQLRKKYVGRTGSYTSNKDNCKEVRFVVVDIGLSLTSYVWVQPEGGGRVMLLALCHLNLDEPKTEG